MNEFRYSEAERCLHCGLRAIIPTRADAEVLVRYSGRRLVPERCPVGTGWHLSYPDVESESRA